MGGSYNREMASIENYSSNRGTLVISLNVLRDKLCSLFKKQFIKKPENHIPCDEPSLEKIVDEVHRVLTRYNHNHNL